MQKSTKINNSNKHIWKRIGCWFLSLITFIFIVPFILNVLSIRKNNKGIYFKLMKFSYKSKDGLKHFLFNALYWFTSIFMFIVWAIIVVAVGNTINIWESTIPIILAIIIFLTAVFHKFRCIMFNKPDLVSLITKNYIFEH